MMPLQLLFIICLAITMANAAASSSDIIPTISASPAVTPDPVVGTMPPPGLSPDLTPRFPSPKMSTSPSPPAPPSSADSQPPISTDAMAPGPASEEAPAPAPTSGGSFTFSATLGFFTSTFVAFVLCFPILA